MWDAVDSGDLVILNDLGVGLQHNSASYMKAVRLPQYCDKPVATWTANTPLGFGGETDTGDDEPIGLSDPLARELYVNEDLRKQATHSSKITNPEEAWASSILRVHEPIHAGLAEQFTHLFGPIRALSFNHTLRIINEGPRLQHKPFVENLVEPIVDSAWSRLEDSEFTQEAIALNSQRNFLEQFNSSGRNSDWEEIVESTKWHRLIEYYLQEGSFPNEDSDRATIEDVIGHAVGDWLAEQLKEDFWKINPLNTAFCLFTPASDRESGTIASPDSVLLMAASFTQNDLEDLSATQQLNFLIERLQDKTNTSFEAIASTNSKERNISSADYQEIGTGEGFEHWQSRQLKMAIIEELWYLIPLYWSSYENDIRGTDAVFWDVLDGIATDVDENNGQLTRRLWLESKYEWARGTPLLKLAVQLWHLREHTLLPYIRTYYQTRDVNVEAHLSDIQDIADGSLPPKREWTEAGNNKKFMEKVRLLHDRTPAMRKQYEHLLNGLNTLGRAIYQEDRDTIATFYRS